MIERSLPHGHVEAALAMARLLELGRLLDRAPSRERDVVVALICQRVLWPASKLASVRAMACSTLAGELGVEDADENEVYAALDWLLERQPAIERRLARRHLKDGGQVLYDVSSSWFEGHSCPLAQLGYSRDGRRGTPQLVYGLCCDRLGRPLAIEAYRGALHDSQTIPDQLAKLRQRFGLRQVVVVVDRGMVTAANLDACREAGFGFITALGAPQVKRLARQGDLQLSLLDETNLAEISSDAFPGERLVVCRNPLVGAERASKRAQLLEATEHELAHVQQRVAAGTLQGSDQIGLAVGSLWNRYRVKKHFTITITDTTLTIERKHDQIATEAALDGLYLLRTNLPPEQLPSGQVVRAYKQLAHVERAHRSLKGPDLELRPIHHHRQDRVRLCLVHARLLPGIPPQIRLARTALQRRTPATRPRPRRARQALTRRAHQDPHQTDHQRPPLPLLADPACRARDPHPQHHPPLKPRRAPHQAPANRQPCTPARSTSPAAPHYPCRQQPATPTTTRARTQRAPP